MSNSVKDKVLYFPSTSEDVKPSPVSTFKMNITPEKTTEAELMDVPLDLIRLNPKNMRFRHITSQLKDVQLEQLIWRLPATKRLYREIKWSRGLQEKPVLERNGKQFIVEEGNMRIVCLRKLKQEVDFGDLDPDDYEIDPVRCIVLPEEVSEREKALLLSRLHVKGKAEWGAFQKAAHIYNMTDKHGFTYDEVSEAVGVSKIKAKRMKRAFKNLVTYKSKFDDKDWMTKYSYFYELEKKRYSDFKQTPLPKGWIEENLMGFMKWIRNGQIKRGREVRELPKIVRDEDAYQCLRSGGSIEGAIEILAQHDPSAGSKPFSKLARLSKAIEGIKREDKIDAAKNTARLKFLKDLRNDITVLVNEIERIREK